MKTGADVLKGFRGSCDFVRHRTDSRPLGGYLYRKVRRAAPYVDLWQRCLSVIGSLVGWTMILRDILVGSKRFA